MPELNSVNVTTERNLLSKRLVDTLPSAFFRIGWIEKFAGPIKELFNRHKRIAQEQIDWEFLASRPNDQIDLCANAPGSHF